MDETQTFDRDRILKVNIEERVTLITRCQSL